MERNNVSSAKVYRRILAGVKDMPEKELLAQEGYYELLNKIAVSMLQKGEKPVEMRCISQNSDATGCTNGNKISINTWSPLVLEVTNMLNYIECHPETEWVNQLPIMRNERQMMYLSNVGTVVHEFGHIMYTDFDLLNDIRERMLRGNFTGCNEKGKLEKLMKSNFSGFLERTVLDVTNILEDCYIENCIKKAYPPTGTASKGLDIANAVKFYVTVPMPELEEKLVKGEICFPDAFTWMMQIKLCLNYTPKKWDKCSGAIHNIMVDALNKATPIVNDYRNSSKNHEKDICEMMDIVATLFPDPDTFNQQQKKENGKGNEGNQKSSSENSGEGGSSTSNSEANDASNGNGSSQQQQSNNESSNGSSSSANDECENIINNQKASEEADKNAEEMEKNSGQSNRRSTQNQRGHAKRGSDDKVDVSKEASKKCSDEDEVSKQIAQDTSEKHASCKEEESLKKAMEEMKGYFPRGGMTASIRPSVSARANKETYEDCYNEVKDISKKCVRQISQILKKRNYADMQSGYLYGTKFNAAEAYREDGKCFSRRLVPDATPDVAFSIMVDESGSMDGSKIEMAQKAAILFDDVSRQLNIPTRIIGHTTSYGDIKITNYVNFKTNDRERYTLGSINASNSNVDVGVLTGLCEEMLKRKEKSKVVIVISDGAPWSTPDAERGNFRGVQFKELDSANNRIATDLGNQELNACVRYYRKKGLKIIGVALDDSDAIKAIYEEGTLDCTRLDKLPSEMVKIFRKYVLK